jgi:hypothetical protein
MGGRMVTLFAGVLLVLSPAAAAKSKDHTPPTFAGLLSAITCVPGPSGGQTTSYTLRWDAATDDRTPSTRIVYDVYQAAVSGGEDFSVPTYTTAPGATSFVTPPLPTSSFARGTAQGTATRTRSNEPARTSASSDS